MFGLGFGEILIVLFLALLFIGPKKLPELAKSLGKGIKEFQKATRDFKDEITNDSQEEQQQVVQNQAPQEKQPIVEEKA